MTAQLELFDDNPEDWRRAWRAMPRFEQDDLTPKRSVLVHFATDDDAEAFAKAIGQTLTPDTRSIWFPEAEIGRMTDKRFVTATPRPPQFPIYIVSKGRADTRFTNKALAKMLVPHYVVVEQAEAATYRAALEGRAEVLVLDPEFQARYDTFDDLGNAKSKGPGPARNFAWEHSRALGADWHWVMDDNITGFYRLWHNIKTPVATGAIFEAMEDFALRYENLAMAGPNYFMFAARKTKMPPFVRNTRIYSCNLIRNDLPFRWRGRYNEDTDLSLRLLKAGWATVLFNAFLAYKLTTQTVAGGNTREFYARDGTRAKSEMLVRMHPDLARLAERFGRVHHFVDYSAFRFLSLRPKPGLDLVDRPDEFGMKLESRDPIYSTWTTSPDDPEQGDGSPLEPSKPTTSPG